MLPSSCLCVSDVASRSACLCLPSKLARLVAVFSLLVVFCWASAAQASSAATTTTLTLANASGASVTTVVSGTAVTLVAQVKAADSLLTVGQVRFCDAKVVLCGYSVSLGTAQLTAAGTAKLTITPGPGQRTYKAVFLGTKSNAASTSANVNLSVTASVPTSMTLTSSSSAPYTLTGTVTGIAANSPSGTVSFTDTTNGLTLGSGTLAEQLVFLGLNTGPTSTLPPASDFILSADFNGDGKLDIAITTTLFFPDQGIRDEVAIQLGNGDGTFTPVPAVELAPNSYADSMVVGDFNGDGKLDIATANNGLNNITILLGNGDGSFTVGSSPSAGSSPISIVTADFNGDGIADLAVSNYESPINILLGKGDGTFTAQAPAADVEKGGLVIADLNGDGIADIAAAGGASSLAILLGNGDGTFTVGTPANTIDNPAVVATGDFNGDGKADLAAANLGTPDPTASSLTILLGNGDGTFTTGSSSPTVNVSTNSTTGYLASADLDGDGLSDLVLVDFNYIYQFISQPDGKLFANRLPTNTDPNYLTVALGDFNGDGLVDIATQNSDTALAAIYTFQTTPVATATLDNVTVAGSGTHTVKATYSGDKEFASTSATVPLAAAALTTKLSLTANPTAPALGAQVLLSATLAPYSDGTLLTNGETVTFLSNGSTIGTGKLSSGTATLNISSLPAGSDSITATYPGDANFAPAKSAAVNVVVATPSPAAVTVSPASLTFAAQPVGTTSSAQTVTLTNSGQSALSITSIAASGPFAETNTCSASIAPGANCQISVTYSPTAAQGDTGAITLTDNATGSPQSIALTGTGSALNVSPSASQLTISSPGGSATDSLQIAPSNGFSGSVSITCAVKFSGTGTANDLPTCSLDPASLTIASGTPGTTKLTVNSTAASARIRNLLLPSGTALATLMCIGFLPRRRRKALWLMLILGVTFTAALSGCGGSSRSSTPKNSGTTTGSYTVSVTVTANSYTSTTTIPLTIQ